MLSTRSRSVFSLCSILVALTVLTSETRSVAAGAAAAVAETQTLLLAPEDTSLNIDANNYSTDTLLTTYTWPDFQVANAVVMKFDLSSVPPGAVISSATLQLALVQTDSSADATYMVSAHKLLGKNPVIARASGYTADGVTNWTPIACCANGVPLAQADISPAYDQQAIDKTPGFKSWTITSLVQEWLADPATNFGVVLNSDASKPRDHYRSFASMEHPDTSLRPVLRITFDAGDATAPSVTITSPPAGSVAGTVSVAVSATDNVGIAGVKLLVDGAPAGTELTSAPFTFNWDSTTLSDGTHTLAASARDGAGNVGVSPDVRVAVTNGIVRVSPQDTFLNVDATNYSTSTVLNTYTWPDFTVANAVVMKFDLSAVPAGAFVTDATLRLAVVQSDGTADATYTVAAHKLLGKNPVILRATGYTADGVAAWTPNACCSNGVPLAQADISPVYDQQVIDKTLGIKSWSLTTMVREWLADPATNFGLLLNSDTSKARDRYRSFASMEHADANLRPYLTINYSMSDSTPPSVAITSPGGGATVSGTTTVTANASDNVGVINVRFRLDGSPLGTKDATAPYSVSWTTTTASNGSHTLTAVARDAAGNVTTSAPVAVTVFNDTVAPTVSVTAPASGATVSATATVTANASDNVGVAGVQFTLDGTNLGAEDTTSPYSVAWQTTTAGNGTHSLAAVARDGAGNRTTSAAVTITVSNGPPPSGGGLAARYPGDAGIENDPDVVFVERFDEATLTDLFKRWTDILNGPTMSFTSDVPPGSPVSHALNIPWKGGGVSSGGHLYKLLSPGVDNTLYLRYYIKYPTSGQYVHHGIWMGGYNPPLTFPNPRAGLKPAGTDLFSAAAEQSSSNLRMDHYDYWMDMHRSNDGNFWGNLLLNSPNVLGKAGQWMCVEQMVKLNTPVTSSNGEHAIWVDGVKVSHVGPGFPNGSWSGGIFTQNPSGTPFGGLRWRSDANLNINYVWLQTFAPNDPAGFAADMRFAHVVAAKSYIGCLTPPSPDTTAPSVSITAPANGSTVSGAMTVSANASDNRGVAGVQFKLDGVNLGAEDLTSPYAIAWDSSAASAGTHTLTAVARDAAGNTKASAAVSVTVSRPTASTWPNEPAGFVAITDQPWSAITAWNRRPNGTERIISDPGAPLSPSSVLEYVYPVGFVDGSAPATHYYPLNTKEVFVGMWWMPSSPWQGNRSFVNKIQFLQVQNSSVFLAMYGPDGGPYALRSSAQWPEMGSQWLTPNASSGVVTLGQWHRLEWYLKYDSSYGAGDGIIRWWMDGVLVGNYTNVRFPNDAGFVEYQISPTWGGNTGQTKTQQDFYRFDHSYLSKR